MGLRDELTGGGRPQPDHRDFLGCRDEGAPYEGISRDETVQRHDELLVMFSTSLRGNKWPRIRADGG
jgi:hypothetical protein